MKGFTVVFLMMITTSIFSQTLEEIALCAALQSNQFYSEVEANSALEKILDASGLAKNFTLTQCDNIDNAAAVSYKGVRYILYDKEFLQTITNYTNDWANLFILAHEVGHHLNGHSVDVSLINIIEPKSLEKKRKQELEADEFAAFILAQLGAPLSALLKPIQLVTSDGDDSYSTHPKKSRRIDAIKKGYSKSQGISKNTISSRSTQTKNINPNYNKSSGIWVLENYNDPFNELKYSSFVIGGVSASIGPKEVGNRNAKFKIDKLRRKFASMVISLEDLNLITRDLFGDINLEPFFGTRNGTFYRSFNISIAVDNEIIVKEVDSWYSNGINNNPFLKDKIVIITSDNTKLLNALKSGNQLLIKIDNFRLHKYPESLNRMKDKDYARRMMERQGKAEKIIETQGRKLFFTFSLSGSSKSLSWYTPQSVY